MMFKSSESNPIPATRIVPRGHGMPCPYLNLPGGGTSQGNKGLGNRCSGSFSRVTLWLNKGDNDETGRPLPLYRTLA